MSHFQIKSPNLHCKNVTFVLLRFIRFKLVFDIIIVSHSDGAAIKTRLIYVESPHHTLDL